MSWLSAYYSSRDAETTTIVLLVLGACISIAILVFFISHMSRQTKGIEEIYKLLYQMQAKKPDKEGNGTNEIAPTLYLQDLKEREEKVISANQEFVEQHENKSKRHENIIAAVFGIGIILFLVIVIIVSYL